MDQEKLAVSGRENFDSLKLTHKIPIKRPNKNKK